MKIVKVYGALKERLGGQGRFEFDVNTPAEALRALIANFPGLEKWMIDSEKDGIGYKVNVGKEQIKEENIEDLTLPWSERDVFSIAPVVAGAKSGWGQILIGAALIGAAFLIPGGWMIGTFGGAPIAVGSVVGGMGVALALGGVAQLLSPTPPGIDMKQANSLQSYSFSGITNTAQIGVPVPIAYGRLYVGSSVISSGLDTDQL